MGIQWVIFDLGGVVIKLKREIALYTLSNLSKQPVEKVRELLTEGSSDFLVYHSITKCYMANKISTNEYLTQLKNCLCVDIDNATLKRIICSMLEGVNYDILNIARRISTQYHLACYTNTHQIHWNHINSAYDVMGVFEKRYASHITGILKPNPNVFQYVENDLKVASDAILFIDDSIQNIEAANQWGWGVIHHQSTELTIQNLQNYLK